MTASSVMGRKGLSLPPHLNVPIIFMAKQIEWFLTNWLHKQGERGMIVLGMRIRQILFFFKKEVLSVFWIKVRILFFIKGSDYSSKIQEFLRVCTRRFFGEGSSWILQVLHYSWDIKSLTKKTKIFYIFFYIPRFIVSNFLKK